MNKLWRLIRYDWPLHFVLLLTNWLPDNVIFLRLRGLLAVPFLGSCGPNFRVGRNVTLYNPSLIHIGKDIYIAHGCWFMAGEKINVGDEVLFGPYCIVVSSNHTKSNGSYRFGEPDNQAITIGHGSWIASRVTITAGSSIGNGVLVAAGAVVMGDIDSNMIAGGIPARVLKESDGGDNAG
jgi:acetyltransferase-like isoleucine patch superfamily enzyme